MVGKQQNNERLLFWAEHRDNETCQYLELGDEIMKYVNISKWQRNNESCHFLAWWWKYET